MGEEMVPYIAGGEYIFIKSHQHGRRGRGPSSHFNYLSDGELFPWL